MIGGEDTFGAGGWEGSQARGVLPVDMDIPAQRQVGKGALVLVMHSCEMPDGTATTGACSAPSRPPRPSASTTRSASSASAGRGRGGVDLRLPAERQGRRRHASNAAIKQMIMGDMPSFDDSMNLAINGNATQQGPEGLQRPPQAHHHHQRRRPAAAEPGADRPVQAAEDQHLDRHASTRTWAGRSAPTRPDPNGDADNPNLRRTMKLMASRPAGGVRPDRRRTPTSSRRSSSRKPPIVRRSLIHEDDAGIPLQMLDGGDDFVKGLGELEPLFGMVLTSKKNDPKVQMPIAAQRARRASSTPSSPTGRPASGRRRCSPATRTTSGARSGSAAAAYSKFWAQVVRGVAAPADEHRLRRPDHAGAATRARSSSRRWTRTPVPELPHHRRHGARPRQQGRATVRLVQTGPGTLRGRVRRDGRRAATSSRLSYPDREGKRRPAALAAWR